MKIFFYTQRILIQILEIVVPETVETPEHSELSPQDPQIDEKALNNEETCSEFSVITGTSRLSSMPSFSSDVQLSSEFTCSEYQERFDKQFWILSLQFS